jgi:sec-independent protein translocase protein TatB
MDGIFGIGPLELFFIAVIALIVLGPERLPSALREITKTIRRVREVTNEFTSQFGDELKALDDINPRKILSEMTDPTKPLPGEKGSETAENKPLANKPVATPKPEAPKAKATANAILSSKAATEAARATKAAKESNWAKMSEAKVSEAKVSETKTSETTVLATSDAADGVQNGALEEDFAEVENSIMPPNGTASATSVDSAPIDASTRDTLPAELPTTDALSSDSLDTDSLHADTTPLDERA